ncbi:MAG: ATP-binding cassette domain-containing protein [Chloroflexi bacterium]|nr:ATP-binding cassette domain-containing protein [Chloroflexota bacterium]
MIQINHLQKVVNHTTLIDIEVLEVKLGEITAVTGLAGTRKQTFLDLFIGTAQPTTGTIRLSTIDPAANRTQFSQQVGILPANNGLYPRLTARQNLTFFCELYGLPAARADEILAQVGLADRAQIRAEDLSAALAKRLAFGRAILHQPSVLLLVDPFVDGDAAAVIWLQRKIREMAGAETAVLIIANESNDIARFCDRILLMEQGKLTSQYTTNETETQPPPFRIPARLEGKVALINPADILYAMVEESRTFLVTGNGRVPTHLNLSEVEERLARSGFFRAHRSYLVNLQHIKEVIAYTRNSYTLILENGSDNIEIPLSKGAARELRELLGY